MKLLLVADPMLPVPPRLYGGIERIVARLITELRARGHTVALAALAGSAVPVDRLFPWPATRVVRRLDTLRNALALRRAAAAFRPDVVHSFARLAYLLPLLRARLPKIMSYQREPGLGQTRRAARWSRPGTLAFTGCSAYIAACGRRGSQPWHAIPNFADTDALRPPAQNPDPRAAPLVFLSRLDDIKGPDTAIAIARAAGRRLILAGNRAETGPQRDFFDHKVQPWLGRDGIEWIGEVDDARKQALLGSAAALLVPIRWDEPFGIVFAEALACGTPVISSPRGALPEIVDEGVTGFLTNDVAAGVAAVARLPELSRPACRRAAETRFSPPVIAAQYEGLYRSLLAAGHS